MLAQSLRFSNDFTIFLLGISPDFYNVSRSTLALLVEGLYILDWALYFFWRASSCRGHDFMRSVCRSSHFEGRLRLSSPTQAVSRFTPKQLKTPLFCSACVGHISKMFSVANLISVSHDFWLFQFRRL